ncbi:MAG: FtsX-like permease family protein, partial [Microbacterium sp.]
MITVRARGARTGTLALIVAVGAACFVATSVVSSTVQQTIEQGTEVEYQGVDIVVRAGHGPTLTPSSDAVDPAIGDGQLDSARELPGVADVGAIVRADAAIRLTNNDPRQLTLESLPENDAFRWQQLVEGELPDDRGEVALSRPTLDSLGFAIGDIVTLVKPGAGSASFRIVGAIDVGNSLRYGLMNYGIVTTPVAQAFAEVSGYNEVRIAAGSEGEIDRIISELPAAMPGGFPQRSAELISGSVSGYAISLATTTTALSMLSLIIALLALLTFAALSWALFPTHRQSLVLMRTVGASRRQLIASTLFSSALLAGVGGLIGAAVGAAVTPLLFWLLALVPGFPTIGTAAIQMDPIMLGLVPVGSAVCGLLAGMCVTAPLLRLSPSGRERAGARWGRVLGSLAIAALIVTAIIA